MKIANHVQALGRFLVVGALLGATSCSHDIAAPNHAADDQLNFEQDGFTLRLFLPLVVGQISFLTTSYGTANPAPASARVISPELARIDTTWSFRDNVQSQVTALAPGQAAIRVVSTVDTTVQTTFHIPVRIARADSIWVDSSSYTVRGRDSLRIAVAVLDQATRTMANSVVGVAVPDGLMTATASQSAIIVHGVKPGHSTLHLTAGDVARDVPITVISAPNADLVATPTGGTLDLLSSGLSGISNFRITRAPTHGTATITSGALHYQPPAGFYGLDSLTYTAKTGSVTESATIKLNTLPGPFDVQKVMLAAELYRPDINDAGQVAGLVTRPDSSKRAVRWTQGRLDTLFSVSSPSGVVGIDNTGAVAGVVDSRVVRWASPASPPDTLLSQSVVAFNVFLSGGGTVGTCVGSSFCYRWRAGVLDSISIPHAVGQSPGILPQFVDDGGDFFGIDPTNSPYSYGAVLYANGTRGSFALPGGRGATGISAVSDAGVAVGISEVSPGGAPERDKWHPFRFDHGLMVDLRPAYPTLNALSGINSVGWMLGTVAPASQLDLVFSGATAPVQALLSDPSLRVESAQLNNTGQMLAVVVDRSGERWYAVLSAPR
jgi:hypothetical protein